MSQNEVDPENYIAVQFEDDSNSKSTIYVMPSSQSEKIFHPQDWSLANF